ncbi:SIMPL domain-containing protein [Naasia lichenicola]|uniref:SIMPL domain-containing protein n=1 Tax=Naasia lichenicola TaxID=2565933 RepID=A0A4S4FRE5_9MICO|nr:SIMPL domain-containing protein [Naasia lichenicola]THG33209.1 SIMPL domain-containing protein [Naasia lichenicola]
MVAISVAGEATRWVRAERAVARVSVQHENEDRATAVEATAAVHTALAREAESHVESGAATRWQTEQLWVSTIQRYVKDSDTTIPIQVARVSLIVRFADWDALSDWVTDVASREGVSIDGIDWVLTEAKERAVRSAVRVDAVHDARAHASAYAGAIGHERISLEAIYEPGLRPNGGSESGGGLASPRMMKASFADSSATIELTPPELEVSASITADFITT